LPPLERRHVVAVLRANGFEVIRQDATDHERFKGTVRGKTCLVDVDHLDEFAPRRDTPLYYMVRNQLGLSYKEFYAGHPDTARMAGLKHKPFSEL
jgi:hypothetical protein